MAQSATQPSYRAYTVIKREGAEDFWQSIGGAFPHQDGKGFNIVLQALPIDGKIVLREPQAADESAPTTREENVTTTRDFKSRRGK